MSVLLHINLVTIDMTIQEIRAWHDMRVQEINKENSTCTYTRNTDSAVNQFITHGTIQHMVAIYVAIYIYNYIYIYTSHDHSSTYLVTDK